MPPITSQTGLDSAATSKRTDGVLKRHAQALWYVLCVILPVIVKSGRRPVIFSRFAGMGDIIGTFPAALALKQKHPGAPVIYNCAASFACLPPMGDITDHLTHFHHIGLIGYWYRRLLAGYYNFGSDDDEFVASHTELFLQGYARRNGVSVPSEHPRLRNQPAAAKKAEVLRAELGLSSPLVLLHPGPTWQVKQWPHEAWLALVAGLRQNGVKTIVQLGTGVHAYSNIGATNAAELPGVISLVDQLSLEECLALISQADLFVGIDSGLLHAAVSFRVRSVGVWGATSPRFLFGPAESRDFVVGSAPCQGCHHRVPRLHWMTGCPNGIICMRQISPENVLRICLSNLRSVPIP